MPHAHTIDAMADLDTQLAHVESRLLDELGSDRRSTIHRAVLEERVRFADARVHAFVPILVERSVRSRLS